MNSRFTVFLFLFLMSITAVSFSNRTRINTLTAEQWSSDIDTFINGMPHVHVNAYHKTSKDDFDRTANELKLNLNNMTDNQIITKLAQLVAMIGDGHTVMDVTGFHGQGNEGKSKFIFHYYPIEAYIFGKDVFIVHADVTNKDLIGKKLAAINNFPAAEVIEKMKTIVPGDNEYNVKFSLPYFMMTAEYLNGLGFCPDNLITEFTFENSTGEQFTKKIEPYELAEYFSFLNNRNISVNAPLYMQNDEKNYWHKYIEDEKLLYINYKRVLIDPDDSLKYFCKRLKEFIDTHDISKTIIDIRNNGGGNNATCQPFVDLISSSEKVNKKGKLFTVIGRQTFSAASYLTTKLEFNTNTIFIGEPTGARPNHYGDNRPLTLGNSALTVRLSSIYWQNSFPADDREFTEPEIKIDISAEDYFSGKDPVLEAVINYENENSDDKKISGANNNSLIGRYILEPLQTAELKEINNELMLEVRKPDFIGRNVSYIYTPVYSSDENKYSTGIRGLTISKNDEGLIFSYRGYDWNVPAAGSGYKLPEELLNEGKIEEAINILKEVKQDHPLNEKVTEAAINNLGYKFLNKKDLKTAIEIFKLNTDLYPQAFNTYDSLGEAYLLDGNDQLALINYTRSFELNERNLNAKKIIDQLSGK